MKKIKIFKLLTKKCPFSICKVGNESSFSILSSKICYLKQARNKFGWAKNFKFSSSLFVLKHLEQFLVSIACIKTNTSWKVLVLFICFKRMPKKFLLCNLLNMKKTDSFQIFQWQFYNGKIGNKNLFYWQIERSNFFERMLLTIISHQSFKQKLKHKSF